MAHVAETFPAAGHRFRFGADVTVRRSGPRFWSHEDFANLAVWQRDAVFIDDFHLAGFDGLADGTTMEQPLGAGDDGRALALRAAVQLPDHVGAEPFDVCQLQPR